MPASAPTGVSTTAVGRMIEVIALVEAIQETEARNPNSAVVVSNLNLDRDTNTGTVSITFEIENSTDPITGALIETPVDPFID